MSKNINFTSFLFQEDPDLDIAWNMMRKTLDQKLPVKRGNRSRRNFLYFSSIAAILLLFLGALLVGTIYEFNYDKQADNSAQKNETIYSTVLNKKYEAINSKITNNSGFKQLNDTGQDSQETLSFNNILSQRKSFNSLFLPIINSKDISVKYSSARRLSDKNSKLKQDILLVVDNNVKYSSIRAETSYTKVEVAELEKMILRNITLLTLNDSLKRTSKIAKIDEQKKKMGVIGFEIGVYYNSGSPLNAIYPIAAITMPVSKRFFLSLGVGLNSQVKINSFAPKEFTVLNDTVNQAYFTVEQKNIRKAVYIDLPASINCKINNRITVNAGVQLSVLQNIDIKAEKRTFDFQADLSQQISNMGFANAGSYTPYHVYAQDYTFMNTNLRFIAGVGYQFKNVGLNFKYQRSFSANYRVTDFNGTKSENRFSIVSVGLTYRIR